ncbi:hypothetical protein E3O25_10915 [Cryobacterium sp. TMT1-3]|uniref:hypothetical protein n=1 Tax=Cryobacterium sp. TMT1-3 TaxID=1259237 RepID=UPI00106B5AFA|nr:hypothetical protein [Cryobacterium sp. TMT1-3]TFC26579.1 hypothetical protein E3O25_10915 [Cryobacterium sp. TMT1-3]
MGEFQMGFRDSISMRQLVAWYASHSKSLTYSFVDAKPSPLLILSTGAYYQIFIYVKDHQFVLAMDDKDPGSIPAQQILGGVGTPPETLMDHAIDTLHWFVKRQRSAGASARADWYEGVLKHLVVTLGRGNTKFGTQLELDGFERAINESLSEPELFVARLGETAQAFLQRGDMDNAVRARYWAGRAAELATSRGDTRFLDYVVANYELALDVLEEGAHSEFESDIRQRLIRLRSR